MEVPGKRIETDEEGDIQVQVCEPCKGDNMTTQATGLCKDCGELMCKSCFRQHLRVKLCKDHELIEVHLSSTPFRNVEKCKHHNGETIKFFCRKHEVVGCGDCMIPGHNACDSESIKNLSANFQQNEDFKSLVRQIEKLTSEHKVNERAVEENKRNNKMMLDRALGDIRKFRIKINKNLDKAEADLISQVRHVMADNDKILTKLEQDCEILSSKIEKIKQTLDTEIYKDNALFINFVECKASVSCIEKEIDEVQSEKMKKYTFVCNEQLRSLASSTPNFGEMDVTISAIRRQTTQPIINKIGETGKQSALNDDSTDNGGVMFGQHTTTTSDDTPISGQVSLFGISAGSGFKTTPDQGFGFGQTSPPGVGKISFGQSPMNMHIPSFGSSYDKFSNDSGVGGLFAGLERKPSAEKANTNIFGNSLQFGTTQIDKRVVNPFLRVSHKLRLGTRVQLVNRGGLTQIKGHARPDARIGEVIDALPNGRVNVKWDDLLFWLGEPSGSCTEELEDDLVEV